MATLNWAQWFNEPEHDKFDRTKDIHSHTDEAGQKIAGFATSAGGIVLFGQLDDKTKTGISISEDDFRHRLSQLRDNLSPKPHLAGPFFHAEGTVVFAAIEVFALGGDGPCFYRNRAYRRDGNRTVPMSQEEIRTFWSCQGKIGFERRVSSLPLSSIDEENTNHYLQIIQIKREGPTTSQGFLDGLHLADLERNKLTTLGVITLVRDPTQTVPASKVILARFQGMTTVNQIASSTLKVPLHKTIADALTFLRSNLPTIERYYGIERKAETVIPDRVLREALINLLAHRDYESQQETVIRVFDDRVDFINPSLTTPDELKKIQERAIPIHRNPLLYNVLRLLDAGEGTGRGIPIIKELMLNAGLPEPVFDVVGPIFSLTLRYQRFESTRDIDKVLRLLTERRILSSSDVMAALDITRPRALELLNELVRRKRAFHKGRTRKSKYYYLENTQPS